MSKDVTFYTPPNILREKVGHGSISRKMVIAAQKKIDENPNDQIYQRKTQKKIERIEDNINKKDIHDFDDLQNVIILISEIKAGGAMFGCAKVSELSQTVFEFLEKEQTVNQEILMIIETYCTSVRALLRCKQDNIAEDEQDRLLEETKTTLMKYTKKRKI